MNAPDLVALVHLVGFVTGIALYGMLAVMIWRGARRGEAVARGGIPLLAAILGLIWNAAALVVFGSHDFGLGELSPWYSALAYTALGFLPAVVVDAATRTPQRRAGPRPLAIFAYGLSGIGGVLQAISVVRRDALSTNGLLLLTLGYALVILFFGVSARRRRESSRALTAVALAAFAVSALHLSRHSSANDSWVVELIGHHASLPLVLVILYQDFRFALADLFLKRALSVLALIAVVVAAYVMLIAPLIGRDPDALRIGVPGMLLTVWVGTALLYPLLRRTTDRFVDRVMLHRVDYREVRHEMARALSAATAPNEALDEVCRRLAAALAPGKVHWREVPNQSAGLHGGALETATGPRTAEVSVPTNDAPGYVLDVASLGAGRRLMSDDIALLDTAAMLVGRRIDELRVSEERYERDLRENDMRRLATEAELRALRAQLNPHFLFNALTTVGHLITTSPPRAINTLYQLTALLRAVLRRTADFVTLREELQLVDAYLAIEQARFEERLHIERDLPDELGDVLVPPLILQPIVENAVKHGISPLRRGGTISIRARVEHDPLGDGEVLRLSVRDTGGGIASDRLAAGRRRGVGLANVESRLLRYYGASGRLRLTSEPGGGTLVEITLEANRRPALAGAI
ncbi:MAG TPA: sensor histidine kinase [Gemmatimonadaceae bacterium]|nr:sensor histidine kinase [Gemmatimonadaceae bacterium]